MSISAVTGAIGHAQEVLAEWDSIGRDNWKGEESWREIQTRYALIDPVLKALGWETCQPKQCYVEYPRPSQFLGDGRVDYALFRQEHDPVEIGLANAVPDIIIETKNAQRCIENGDWKQLQGYVKARPAMTQGTAVLADGRQWWLYRIDERGRLPETPTVTVKVEEHNPDDAAKELWRCLARKR